MSEPRVLVIVIKDGKVTVTKPGGAVTQGRQFKEPGALERQLRQIQQWYSSGCDHITVTSDQPIDTSGFLAKYWTITAPALTP